MPLVHSASKKAREENIHREIEAGKPIKQAVAIGYSEQRQAESHGKKKAESHISRATKRK